MPNLQRDEGKIRSWKQKWFQAQFAATSCMPAHLLLVIGWRNSGGDSKTESAQLQFQWKFTQQKCFPISWTISFKIYINQKNGQTAKFFDCQPLSISTGHVFKLSEPRQYLINTLPCQSMLFLSPLSSPGTSTVHIRSIQILKGFKKKCFFFGGGGLGAIRTGMSPLLYQFIN